MTSQGSARQSLRPIGRPALTLMLPDEVFASRGKQEIQSCSTPSPLTSGSNSMGRTPQNYKHSKNLRSQTLPRQRIRFAEWQVNTLASCWRPRRLQ